MSRHVIITGASRGIGAAIAQHFIDLGDKVVGMSRSGTTPQGCVKSFAVDVSNSTSAFRSEEGVRAKKRDCLRRVPAHTRVSKG